MGRRFKQVVAGMAQPTVKRSHLQLAAVLSWIGTSANPHCRAAVAEASASGRITSTGEREDALFSYRHHLIAGTASDRSVDSAIKALRTMLGGLSSGGVIPETSTPLPGVKHARRRSGHLRSVAEASAKDNGGSGMAASLRPGEPQRTKREIEVNRGA